MGGTSPKTLLEKNNNTPTRGNKRLLKIYKKIFNIITLVKYITKRMVAMISYDTRKKLYRVKKNMFY